MAETCSYCLKDAAEFVDLDGDAICAECADSDAEYCPNGCGCRKGTDDSDRMDCACDGPCCMDLDWGPGPDFYASDEDDEPHESGPEA